MATSSTDSFVIMTKVIRNDFKYGGVKYEYDSYNCVRESCGCRDRSDYCRGKKHEGLRVTEVDLNAIREKFLERTNKSKKYTKDEKFIDYCVDRLIRFHGMYETSNWTIETERGYYGEEIGAISFNDFNALVEDVKEVIELTPNERIEFVLKREYGYLLNEVKNLTWKLKEVPFQDLMDSRRNDEYKKMIKGATKAYEDHDLPMGVYIEKSDKTLRLIDGYHRFCSMMETCSPSDVVSVVVGRNI